MKRILSAFLTLLALLLRVSLPAGALTEYPAFSFTRENGVILETRVRSCVDFETGLALNGDLSGWLCAGALGEGFPVMTSTQDNLYRTHTWLGDINKGHSCCYLPIGLSRDFSERTLTLCGDSGKNGPFYCFRTLTTQRGYEENPYFRLLTPERDYQLDLFAGWSNRALSPAVLTPPEAPAEFDAWLRLILQESDITPLSECLPASGERIVILTNDSRSRPRTMLAVLRPILYRTDERFDYTRFALDSHPLESHATLVEGVGNLFVFYQKDALWENMRFESEQTIKRRKVSGGACGPFALSNILINILSPGDFLPLLDSAQDENGLLFCSCSVNRLYCEHTHIPYRVRSEAEVIRYLPVVLCSFASGNNRYGVRSRWPNGTGTNTLYVPYVCEALRLRCVPVDNLADGLRLIEENGNRGGLLCCALDSSPFAPTSNQHFVCVIGVRDGYAYVLDSLYKKSYVNKTHNVEKLGDGVARFPADQPTSVSLIPYFYIEKPDSVSQT